MFQYTNQSVQAPLRPSLHELALLRFYYDFINPSDKYFVQKGTLEPLPGVYASSSSESCLHSAVSACAYANFGGRFKSEETRKVGAQYYGKALKSLATATANMTSAMSTESLVSAYLCSLYEVLFLTSFVDV